jgi:hypothetical protein
MIHLIKWLKQLSPDADELNIFNSRSGPWCTRKGLCMRVMRLLILDPLSSACLLGVQPCAPRWTLRDGSQWNTLETRLLDDVYVASASMGSDFTATVVWAHASSGYRTRNGGRWGRAQVASLRSNHLREYTRSCQLHLVGKGSRHFLQHPTLDAALGAWTVLKV